MTPFTWNADRETLARGRLRTSFSVKWRNYLDGQDWRAIDLTPRQVSGRWRFNRGNFDLECAPTADGLFRFDATVDWDVHAKQRISASPKGFTKTIPGALPVPAQVIGYELHYPGAMPGIGADIIVALHEQWVRFIYQWTVKPPGVGEYIECPVDMEFDDAPEKVNGHRDIGPQDELISAPLTHRSAGKRGVTIKRAKLWDSRGNWTWIQLRLRRQGRRLVGVKLVPRAWVEMALATGAAWVRCDTTSTFYPDAHTESTSCDGEATISSPDTAFGTIRSGNGTSARDNQSDFFLAYMLASMMTGYDEWRRGITIWDTSALGDSDTIDSATASWWVLTVDNGSGGAQDLRIVGATSGSSTAIQAADYQGNVGSNTSWADPWSLGGLSTGAYNDAPLNATGLAGISKTGVTKIGGRLGGDVSNSDPFVSPGMADAVGVSGAEHTGTTQDPKLVVEHTAGGGGGTTKNTRAFPLGVALGMHRRMPL